MPPLVSSDSSCSGLHLAGLNGQLLVFSNTVPEPRQPTSCHLPAKAGLYRALPQWPLGVLKSHYCQQTKTPFPLRFKKKSEMY